MLRDKSSLFWVEREFLKLMFRCYLFLSEIHCLFFWSMHISLTNNSSFFWLEAIDSENDLSFFAILRDCNQCIGKHLCIAVSLNLSLFLCLQIKLCLLVWLCLSFHISRSLSLCLSLTQIINVSTVQNKLEKGLISRELIFKMALTPPFLRMYCFLGFS